MKYQKHFLLSLAFMMILVGVVYPQQSTKVKRPVKNPPQYPNIIDLENKEGQQNPQVNAQEPANVANQQADALVQVMTSLATEVRTLVQELRTLNIRQQAQLDMLRMNRLDMRIDHYERELRPVRERIAALETEEQNLYRLMTPESLLAQSANIGTVNRDQTMLQIKLAHEARLRNVQNEKERLRKVESDLLTSMGIYQNLAAETERKIQESEETLRQLENAKTERKP